MEFKDKVYQARMKLGLSQEAFAKELNVGIASINRWENGATKPNKLNLYWTASTSTNKYKCLELVLWYLTV